MRRRWWHTLIIASSVLAIAGIGVTAIWGASIRDFLGSSQGSDEAAEQAGPAGGPDRGQAGVL